MRTSLNTLFMAVLLLCFFSLKQTALTAQPLPLEVIKCQEFFHNVENGNLGAVLHCLSKNPALLSKYNEDGLTALLLATQAGQTAMVELLIHQGCDVTASSISQLQASHLAILNNDLPTLKVLLQHGAPLYATTGSGKSLYELAQQSGNKKLQKYVLANFKNARIYF